MLGRILIVDDEAPVMQALLDTLRAHGYEADGFVDGAKALHALRATHFDLLLSDLMMPGMNGVELLTAALQIDPQLVGVLMTGMGTVETAVQAMKAGALDYVLKPIKLRTLLPVLSRALDVRRLRQENMELRDAVAIHELNQAMAHTLEPSTLLDRIADAAMAQFQAEEVAVMLVTEEGDALQTVVARGEQRGTQLGKRVPLSDDITEWVASHSGPLVMAGEVSEAPWLPRHSRPEIQSALSLPMIARNKLIGVINVNCLTRRHAFTPGQIKVLDIFANAAAANIEAVRMHDAQRKADARYREVLQMVADGIISVDDEQRIVVFNAGAVNVFGYQADEVLGQPLDAVLPAQAVVDHRQHAADVARKPSPSDANGSGYRIGRRKDGTLFPAEVDISKPSEAGTTLCTAVVRDITTRLQQEDRIARLTRLYAVLSAVNTAIVRMSDEIELYAEICRVAVEKGGFRSAFIGHLNANASLLTIACSRGLTIDAKRITPASPSTLFRGVLGQAIEQRKVAWENKVMEGVNTRKNEVDAIAFGAQAVAALPLILDDSVHGVMVVHSTEPDSFGDEELALLNEMTGDVSFALDYISKKKQLDYVATHDLLTGLPNRSLFLDRLSQAITTAREKRRSVAVVLGDIERFKQLNNALGRHSGDALLRKLADRIRGAVQGSASLARVGGDVFGLIFTEFNGPSDVANSVLKRVGNVISGSFDVEGRDINIVMRAGSAIFPSDGDDAEAIFHNAEAALKRAKDLHEPLVFYTPSLNARVAERLSIENKLRRAFDRNQFCLHYQPKVDMRNDSIVGLEALLRWHDPEVGLVPAARFVTILEESGLILEAGRWAMNEAVRAVASLRAAGLPPLRIAVNVSSIQLRQDDFVRSVREAIEIASDASHGLDLEITESVIMHDIDANVYKLNEVRAMGVGLAIDDFGTGYSSLAYMARLPIGVVKIDRSFVQELERDSNSKAVVSTIISLSHALSMKTVAEGVETKAQAALLRDLGCDQYQGYLFSKPVSQCEIERLLARMED